MCKLLGFLEIARKQDFHLEDMQNEKKQRNKIHTKKNKQFIKFIRGEEKYLWKFIQTKYKQFVFEVLKHAARNLEVKAWTINQI